MIYVVMPYRGNLDQTARAVQDVLTQSIDTRLLLIANGGPPLPYDHPDVLHWHFDPALPSLSAVWNRALQMVWEAGGTEALVVNNDVRLHHQTVEALSLARARSGAWFVSACNVGDQFEGLRDTTVLPWDDRFLIDGRGGPDFSCFLIGQECHRWFQFDEQFIPAYYEDNDYHRRLQLAGFGDRIFSVPVPYLHYGSGTLKADAQLAAGWAPIFQRCQDYYVKKWGGRPGQETHEWPFNLEGYVGVADNFRELLTGQGRPDAWLRESGKELFHADRQ